MNSIVKYSFVLIIIILLFVFGIGLLFLPKDTAVEGTSLWKFQAIDTMKYSRDTAREKLNDSSFDIVIDRQVKEIADTGATHIGIATPYDEEFYPFLKEWVDAARKYHLKVWFRGNMSGWEGWFGYPKIDRTTHTQQVVAFIKNHPELFEDGDAFSSCPECENGGPGDPRLTGDVSGHRKFLIDEYNGVTKAFDEIGKDVKTNYHSMNGDVAKLIMDGPTTKALGNAIVIDHYVKTPEQLASDIAMFSNNGEHDVILGEFGAPIPDIHGDFSEEDQARWLDETLSRLVQEKGIIGLSYWTNVGGSTELWDADGKPRKAVEVLSRYYKPTIVTLSLKNDIGQLIDSARVTTLNRTIEGTNGQYGIPMVFTDQIVHISANGYPTTDVTLLTGEKNQEVRLTREKQSLWYKIQKFFKLPM